MIQLLVLISLGHFKQMSYDQLSFPTILSLFWLNVNVPIQEPKVDCLVQKPQRPLRHLPFHRPRYQSRGRCHGTFQPK